MKETHESSTISDKIIVTATKRIYSSGNDGTISFVFIKKTITSVEVVKEKK